MLKSNHCDFEWVFSIDKRLYCIREGKVMDTISQLLNFNNPIFYLILIWSLIWKGIALWHSARNKQLVWFVTLLIVNTVGILEIIYLIFFRNDKKLYKK